MKKKFYKIFICILFLISAGCSTVSYETIYPTLIDGKYDSEFPYKSTSEELKKISETIQRINTTAFYKIYIFHQEENITVEDLKSIKLSQKAERELIADNSAAGTAVVLYSSNGNVALLTCAHTLTFKDTVYSFRLQDNGSYSQYLESILIKEKQVIYVAGFPEGSQLDILAIDDETDLALIGKSYGAQQKVFYPVFNYPFGNAKEVEWGTFVYLLGYPINYKIITKAIASYPKKEGDGSFFVDAVINPGFSGGPVLAIRDGVPNFELIGIVQWVPEEEESLVYPQKLNSHSVYNPVVPYKGDLFVKKHKSIRYGIAKVIPVENILKFILSNKTELNKKGFYIFE
ncbi:MAG: serine protease [Ignavibacterium sp.]|nr:serine protease [Ignavibacterium sp.]